MSIGRFGTYMTHILETGFEIMKKKIQTVALRSEDTILSQEGFVIRAMVGHSRQKSSLVGRYFGRIPPLHQGRCA